MASVADLIGNTPLVELQKLNTNRNVKILAKLEGDNPGGSVKDRPAFNMIKSALDRGDINTNTKLIAEVYRFIENVFVNNCRQM